MPGARGLPGGSGQEPGDGCREGADEPAAHLQRGDIRGQEIQLGLRQNAPDRGIRCKNGDLHVRIRPEPEAFPPDIYPAGQESPGACPVGAEIHACRFIKTLRKTTVLEQNCFRHALPALKRAFFYRYYAGREKLLQKQRKKGVSPK